jgi:hypothetical protein
MVRLLVTMRLFTTVSNILSTSPWGRAGRLFQVNDHILLGLMLPGALTFQGEASRGALSS